MITFLLGFILGILICLGYIYWRFSLYRKNVKYFVKFDDYGTFLELVKVKGKKCKHICNFNYFFVYGLNPNNYGHLKRGEAEEVTINMQS